MNTELQTLEAAWAELDAEFATFAQEEQDFSGINLEQFEALVAEANLTDFQIDNIAEEGLLDWLNPFKKAAKIVNNLIKVARSVADRCPEALAAVAKVVSLFKARNYLSAIKAGYDAYKIIKRCDN